MEVCVDLAIKFALSAFDIYLFVFALMWCLDCSIMLSLAGTIFAYGQTGTGKTFTMEGIRSIPEKRGIIPNSFAHVFGHIAKAEEDIRWVNL